MSLSSELAEAASEWKVVPVQISTRATRRSTRTPGSSPSEGKGFREAWQIEGPWDPESSYHNGIKTVRYKRKADALAQAERLSQGAK